MWYFSFEFKGNYFPQFMIKEHDYFSFALNKMAAELIVCAIVKYYINVFRLNCKMRFLP